MFISELLKANRFTPIPPLNYTLSLSLMLCLAQSVDGISRRVGGFSVPRVSSCVRISLGPVAASSVVASMSKAINRSILFLMDPINLKQKNHMKLHQLIAIAALAMFSSGAFAYRCSADMRKIDAALEKNQKLNEAQAAEVRKLRAEGEALHNKGKHKESVETLGKAMNILGIK